MGMFECGVREYLFSRSIPHLYHLYRSNTTSLEHHVARTPRSNTTLELHARTPRSNTTLEHRYTKRTRPFLPVKLFVRGARVREYHYAKFEYTNQPDIQVHTQV